jgi:hypothetical protein
MLTAIELARADQGDEQARRRVRILTPLIKFRACRDARRATGDAMEMRGGCGYIEEWSDPRLVRDAHLGSIWEGTSNIVALDVIRAARREGALPVLDAHLRGLLADTPMHPQVRTQFGQALGRALTLAGAVAEAHGRSDAAARQAASALYHASTAIAMAWEAGRTHSARRMRIAQLVLKHRLLPHDPLAPADEPAGLAELLEPTTPAPREPLEAIYLL